MGTARDLVAESGSWPGWDEMSAGRTVYRRERPLRIANNSERLTRVQLQRLKASRNVFSAHLDNLFSKLL